MPLELGIIRATEFARMGAHGKFDLAASKSALATPAEACRKRGDEPVVNVDAPNQVQTRAVCQYVGLTPLDAQQWEGPGLVGDQTSSGSAMCRGAGKSGVPSSASGYSKTLPS